jgi:predicted O-linked N-acetylglucosamine transferase (SPINDLY family)
MRARIEAAFDEIVPIRSLNDDAAARAVVERDIDILINLNGFFGHARTGLFARRPAPVQVNYLGFPGTIGAPYIDYIFADARVIPAESEQYFTEQVIHVGTCYQPRDQRARPTVQVERGETGLPEAAFVYCCFNKTYKITPTIWSVWMRILKRVPDSVLWLLSDAEPTTARLKEAASAHGVSPARLIFAERWPHARHLARHALADLFLDTVPCNAHTTAADALLAGLPVLTCEGKTFAGRVASSLLQHHKISHWIARDMNSYETLAIEAAGRLRSQLTQDRQRLKQRQSEDYSEYFAALRRIHAMGARRP